MEFRQPHFLALVLIGMLSTAAHAQYAGSRLELNWTFDFLGETYGLHQYVVVPGEARTTTVFVGSFYVELRWRAWVIVAAAVLVPAVIGAAAWRWRHPGTCPRGEESVHVVRSDSVEGRSAGIADHLE